MKGKWKRNILVRRVVEVMLIWGKLFLVFFYVPFILNETQIKPDKQIRFPKMPFITGLEISYIRS